MLKIKEYLGSLSSKLHNLFCLVFVWGIFERVSLDFSTPMLKNEENEGHFAIGHSKLCPQFTTMAGEITVCIHENTKITKENSLYIL